MSNVDYYDLTNLKALDLDKVAKQLKIEEHGKLAGKANHPRAIATKFDENERDIIGRLQSHRADIRGDHAKRLQALDGDIAAQKSKVLSEVHISEAKNRFIELKHDLKSEKRSLKNGVENFRSAKFMLNKFKQERGILDVPPKEKSFIDNFAILIIFVILEALANLVFFAEGNEFGVLGGYLIAIAISVFNVGLFYVFGLFFLKLLNSSNKLVKIFGGLAWGLVLVALPLFHGLIAFYRQARMESQVELSASELTQKAWLNLKTMNIETLDITSLALFVVGIGFGLYAAYKGFIKGHPYPGYDRKYKTFKSFEYDLEDIERNFRDQYIDGIFEISNSLKGILSNQSSVKASIQKLALQKSHIMRRVDEVDEELARDGNTLLSRYRSANRQARSKPAPEYFDDLFISEDHFGVGTLGKNYADLSGALLTAFDTTALEHKASTLLNEMDLLGEELDSLLEIDDE